MNKKFRILFTIVFIFVKSLSLLGSTLTSPSGNSSSWGTVFFGLGGMANLSGTGLIDGSSSLGMGLGDPNDFLGVTVILAIGSINPMDGGALERGYYSFAIGHNFLESKTSVAVGLKDMFGWNTITKKKTPYYSLAVTQDLSYFIKTHYPVTVNFGIGNLSLANKASDFKSSDWGYYYSCAIKLHPQLTLIYDYTGVITTLGVAAIPIAGWPVSLSLGLYDFHTVTKTNVVPAFMGGISLSHNF